jgi:hypothetical protein
MTDTQKPPTISVTRSYGLFYYWTLVAFGKAFYLGQDSKFCQRILQKDGNDVIAAIGSSDMRQPETRQKLAAYIIEQLGLTEEKANALQEWELCAE